MFSSKRRALLTLTGATIVFWAIMAMTDHLVQIIGPSSPSHPIDHSWRGSMIIATIISLGFWIANALEIRRQFQTNTETPDSTEEDEINHV